VFTKLRINSRRELRHSLPELDASQST
jgi:hypothetical protein